MRIILFIVVLRGPNGLVLYQSPISSLDRSKVSIYCAYSALKESRVEDKFFKFKDLPSHGHERFTPTSTREKH
jgi:hypothetical protein